MGHHARCGKVTLQPLSDVQFGQYLTSELQVKDFGMLDPNHGKKRSITYARHGHFLLARYPPYPRQEQSMCG